MSKKRDALPLHVGHAAEFRSGRPAAVARGLLLVLVASLFFPILTFEFVDFDVYYQVVANPYIRSLSWENVRGILTTRSITSYYPVRTLSYALDYHFWGLSATGFGLTNLALHAMNVLMAFGLVRRALQRGDTTNLCAAPGGSVSAAEGRWLTTGLAAWAAAIYAVHPLVVEPVAWIGGREELLMTLGVLAAVRLHIAARDVERAAAAGRAARRLGAAYFDALAIVACAMACLSNAVGAVTPFLVLFYDLVDKPSRSWRRTAAAVGPMWAIAAVTIVLKRFDPLPPQTLESQAAWMSAVRIMMIAEVYAHNVQAIFWPRALACNYLPVQPHGWSDPQVLLGLAAIAATAAAVVLVWRRPAARFGLGWFLLTLGPTSQIVPHHVHRADRFLYLPLVGLVMAVAALVAPTVGPLASRLTRRNALALLATAGMGIVALLDYRAAAQVRVWENSASLWRNCLEVVPENALAHAAWSDALVKSALADADPQSKRRKYSEAIAGYRQAMALDSDLTHATNNLALLLANCELEDLRDYRQAVELAEEAARIAEGTDPDIQRTLATAHTNLAVQLARQPEPAQAEAHYRQAIAADPTYVVPQLNLALLLATAADPSRRRPDEAVRLAEESTGLLGSQRDGFSESVRAAAHAAAGQFAAATEAAQNAVALARAAGRNDLLPEFERRLALYRSGQPYRDP